MKVQAIKQVVKSGIFMMKQMFALMTVVIKNVSVIRVTDMIIVLMKLMSKAIMLPVCSAILAEQSNTKKLKIIATVTSYVNMAAVR